MISHPAYEVEPWGVRETALHLDVLAQSESVFALSNGHIGWRGNLDEGEPHGLPGSYLNGVYETRPLPYAEAGYGDPETGQTVINVINGKLIRLLVDDQPFDVRYGEVRRHERFLDLRAGVLRRDVEWCSASERTVRVRSTRLVSLAQRAVAAVCHEVEAVDRALRLVVQSELVANEALPKASADPRDSAMLESPLRAEHHHAGGCGGSLLHRTNHSGLQVAAAMDHVVDGPPSTRTSAVAEEDLARVTVTSELEPGERLRLVKFVAYGWSSARSRPAVRDQVAAALAGARDAGWKGLLDAQRRYLDWFWARADVEVDGDPEIQQAVRFALFHLLQAAARAEGRAIAAKGLTGPGYDGHCFWDTETFVLPALTYSVPETVAHALRWRHSILPAARSRARQLGLRGAAFPWRTIAGAACSGYWPAGVAAFHIGADIADAVTRYVAASADERFARNEGLELLVETARLWASLGFHDGEGRFRIDGVTGPDEYSAVADNNLYTNLMARHNLEAAADAAERYVDQARRLGVDEDEARAWRAAAQAIVVPFDEQRGVHLQAEGYTAHQVWDCAATAPDHYPLMLHYAYFDLYRKQVVKQADLVLALYLRGEAFTAEEKARDFAYYEAITVRDSSLSAGIQAVVAAEVGHMALAYDYLAEAALMDLDDLEDNTRDGLHLASLAGAWAVLVAGFGGMRTVGDVLHFVPRLPQGISRISFTVTFRRRRLQVEILEDHVTYELLDGEPLTFCHDGQLLKVSADSALVQPTVAAEPGGSVSQPPGRQPRRRRS